MTSALPSDTDPGTSLTYRPGYPVPVRMILSTMRRGAGDPSQQHTPDGAVWRASLMPSGPVSYRISQRARDVVEVTAWGPGSAELLAGLPDLLGAGDRPETFTADHPVLLRAIRDVPGYRVPRTGRVVEALVPAVLEQKVIGLDAFAAWRRLLQWHGTPAPGPVPDGMRVPPDAATWLEIPTWDWHRAGVDPKRQRALRSVLRIADKLQTLADTGDPSDFQVLYRAMRSVPGIGVWTAAEVGSRALGDADALPLGDYHLPATAGYALVGRKLADDEVEPLLEPYRPHRYRVVRLLELSPSVRIPRFGPRLSRLDHRRR